MKKILLFVFILGTNWCAAQVYVNQKNLNTANYQYIEVWEKFNRSSNKFVAMVDYGQDLQKENAKSTMKLRNPQGGVLEFNSIVAILNYCYMNGWELTQLKTTEDIESYLLKKRSDFAIPILQESASPAVGSNR